MPKTRVAICHQTVVGGDAIGNDIAGMYHLLERLGLEPVIVCENFRYPHSELRVHNLGESEPASYDLVVYHHSQDWTGARNS